MTGTAACRISITVRAYLDLRIWRVVFAKHMHTKKSQSSLFCRTGSFPGRRGEKEDFIAFGAYLKLCSDCNNQVEARVITHDNLVGEIGRQEPGKGRESQNWAKFVAFGRLWTLLFSHSTSPVKENNSGQHIVLKSIGR